jgi:photosystem II stability/assembly factor-like uncharacterized protein
MKFGKVKGALIVIILAFGNLASSQAETLLDGTPYRQDFNSGTAGEWKLEPGWAIAPSGDGYVLQGSEHSWAVLMDKTWEDIILQFRVNLKADSGLHANIRKSGPSRYFIGLGRDFSYISRQDKEKNFQNQLANGAGIPSGWHTIRISAMNGQIEVMCDGTRFISYTDPDPLVSGSVAFENLNNSTTLVDDIQIETSAPELASEPPAGPQTDANLDATQLAQEGNPNPSPQPAAPDSTTGGLSWVYTGGPLGGLGYDVRMSPDNPDIMFVTDAKAGVFKSTDGGKTWFPSSDGITSRIGSTGELIPVFSLTISPTDPNLIWAGTTETRGAFKSTDSGRTWKKMDNGMTGQNLTLRGFAIEPGNNNVVYSAGEVPSWDWNGTEIFGRLFDKTKGIVFKSIDGGQSWKEVWKGNNLARYVLIDPRNPDVLYLSTGIFDREAANSDWKTNTPGGEGVLKSTDGGQTWRAINNGIRNLYIGSLFMHPTNPDILLAGAGNNTYRDGGGVYITKDGGETWKQTLSNDGITSVEISTLDPNRAYAGQFERFYRSDDGGNSWNEIVDPGGGWGPPGLLGGQPIDFQVDPRNADRLFSNSYGGGNFLTEDGGRTWVDTSRGYSGAMVRDLAVDPAVSGHIFATASSGYFESRDGGRSWTTPNRSFRANIYNIVAVNPSNSAQVIAQYDRDSQLVLSTDGGRTFIPVHNSPGLYGGGAVVYAPSDPSVVYYGDQSRDPNGFKSAGILRSHDGGATWESANDPNSEGAVIFQLAVHPQDARMVYAATMNRGVLKTTNGGSTWSPIGGATFASTGPVSPELSGTTSIEIAPWDNNNLFAGINRKGLWISVDAGISWKRSSNGLNPEATIRDVVCDPVHPKVLYLADVFSGVYRSQDGGQTWTPINTGLLNRAVNKLALSTDGMHLYAATEGMGVFRLDLNSQPPDTLPEPTQEISPTESAGKQLPTVAKNLNQAYTDIQSLQTVQAAGEVTKENPVTDKSNKAENPIRPRCSLLPVSIVTAVSLWNLSRKRKVQR